MAEYTVILGRKKAESLVQIMCSFRGGSIFVPHRLKLMDAIAKTFPSLDVDAEVAAAPAALEDEKDKTVSLVLDSRKQRALYEGFLSILHAKDKNGADDFAVRRAARAVQLWNEVEKGLKGASAPEFDGIPDGEEADLKPDGEEAE